MKMLIILEELARFHISIVIDSEVEKCNISEKFFWILMIYEKKQLSKIKK